MGLCHLRQRCQGRWKHGRDANGTAQRRVRTWKNTRRERSHPVYRHARRKPIIEIPRLRGSNFSTNVHWHTSEPRRIIPSCPAFLKAPHRRRGDRTSPDPAKGGDDEVIGVSGVHGQASGIARCKDGNVRLRRAVQAGRLDLLRGDSGSACGFRRRLWRISRFLFARTREIA